MNKKIIYDNEPCLSEKELLAYVQGKYDATLERRVELHVADCGLCSDALDGLQSTDNQQFEKENQDIKRHLKEQFFPTKIISIFSKRNLSIAASITALMFGFWWWSQNDHNKTIAQNEPKQNPKENPIVSDIKTETTNSKVSEKEIIALADENISPKKSKIQKSKNAPVLITTSGSVSIVADNESNTAAGENVAIVPNATTSATSTIVLPTAVTTPTQSGTYTYDNDYAEKPVEKTPIKEEEKAKAKEDVPGKLKNTNDYKFYSDSLNKYDDAQKYVTHQNSYDPGKSLYPSAPAKNIAAKTETATKKKDQTPVKPTTKSKSNPKTNIEYSQADDKLLNEGIREYQKNRPQQAIAIFDRLLAKDPYNDSAIFYKGASQAIDNQCFEAVSTLQLFNNSYPEGSAANSEATWLIANCQLKLMQRESAILLLKQLAEFYNPRQDDAKKLLEKL